MKKVLLFMLTLVIAFTLTACGDDTEERVYTDHTLTVIFVPSRPADEILTMTAPLEQMLLDELALAGYDVAGVDILVSSSYEAAGIAMLSGTGDVAFLPGGTYVMFADTVDSPVEVILSAARSGLTKDSSNAADWNDGLATEADETVVSYYKGLIVAGTSAAGRVLADKVNAGDDLVWDDIKDLNWCVRSATSSSGYIYPNLWVYSNFDGKTFDDMANISETAGYGATMAELATGTCDVGTIYADARRDYADNWTEDYGRTLTVWDETDVVGVTGNIMNDTISVSRINLDQGIIDAIQQAFINIAKTDAGLAVMEVYSHTNYVVALDSDYDSARDLREFMGN
jgi:phosphonate transport system substrate-binding protein